MRLRACLVRGARFRVRARPDSAAYLLMARVLLNLDETITKE